LVLRLTSGQHLGLGAFQVAIAAVGFGLKRGHDPPTASRPATLPLEVERTARQAGHLLQPAGRLAKSNFESTASLSSPAQADADDHAPFPRFDFSSIKYLDLSPPRQPGLNLDSHHREQPSPSCQSTQITMASKQTSA
jgi:hypothetical protein